VKLFQPTSWEDKVPQIGWNAVQLLRQHPIFEGIENGSEFYFVHSYYPDPENCSDVVGVTDYAGVEFASVIGRGNLVATQFHPEKSGRIGLSLFKNFSRWDGRC
jgi:glutamine amidotransferase